MPARLEPCPWHARQWRQVMASRAAGRLHHALLLAGPAGVGKRPFATALAASLLCESPDPQGVACGTCRSCHLFAAATHPDLMEVGPEAEGKQILVDHIRELERFQGLKAQYRGKVVVIEPADRMNVNAANALLKTLEEPTGGTYLLLLTGRPQALLPTIRSRCQKLPFPPVDAAEAVPWLRQEGVEEGAERLLALAGGAPLRALAMAREGVSERRGGAFEQFRALAAGQADPVVTANRWAAEGLAERLTWLYQWLADLVRLRLGSGAEDPQLAGRLQGVLETVDLELLFARLDGVQAALRDLQGPCNLNPQLLAESLLIPWAPGRRPPR